MHCGVLLRRERREGANTRAEGNTGAGEAMQGKRNDAAGTAMKRPALYATFSNGLRYLAMSCHSALELLRRSG